MLTCWLFHLIPCTYKINSRWIEYINTKKQNFKMFKRKYRRMYKIVKFLYTHAHTCTILYKCVSMIMYVLFPLSTVFLLGNFLPYFPPHPPCKSFGPPASALAHVSHTMCIPLCFAHIVIHEYTHSLTGKIHRCRISLSLLCKLRIILLFILFCIVWI